MNPLMHAIIILVHGTWAHDSVWYMPGSTFFDALQMQANKYKATVVPFSWTGKNNYLDRQTGAHSLAQLILSYPEDKTLYLVGHSHGGNVILYASHIVATKNPCRTIDSVYLLGTPAHRQYEPNMLCIQHLYNIVSFDDDVQTVLGNFGRKQPDHPRIANLRITINGKNPGHSELHSTLVAFWLLPLDKRMRESRTGSFADFSTVYPGVLHIGSEHEPIYTKDAQWDDLTKRDEYIHQALFGYTTILKKVMATSY